MRPSRSLVRSLLVILLIAGCVTAAVAPILMPASAAPKAAAAPSDLVISEVRFQGSGGEADEFVELFNRSCTTPVSLDGWTLEASKGTLPHTILYAFPPTASVLPGHYYLLASTAYDDVTSIPDQVYALPGIDSKLGGVALFKPGSTDPVDQVGFEASGFAEGTPLTFQVITVDKGYTRKTATSGRYVDINDNAEDFLGPVPSDPQNSGVTGTCGIPSQTISGNAGQPSTILRYKDVTTKSVTANASGNYTITVPANWSGTVTPSKPGYSFAPADKTYSNVLANQPGQNYTASISTPTRTPVPNYLSIVINEVAWGGTQESSGDQWIELYNPKPWDITVKDWTLRGAAGTNGKVTLTGVIKANCYLVIVSRSNIFQDPLSTDQCKVRTLVDTNLVLSTYGAALFLNSDTGALIDTANNNLGPWPAGLGGSAVDANKRATMERHAVITDTDTVWYTFAGAPRMIVYDRGGHAIKGTPGQRNWAYSVNATPSPVPTRYKTPTSPPPTPFAHMVINEWLPRAGHDWNHDGAIDVYDEFIEVKNLGPIDVDLVSWKLDVISSAGSSAFILPSTKLKPDQRAVFYRSTSKLALPDSGGTVRLTNNRGVIIDARSYDPVDNPDESICRLPDGFYWQFPCFPTPGLENTKEGFAPAPPPNTAGHPPACLLPDTVPQEFRDAECNGFGSDIFNPKYWDDQSGFQDFPVLDVLNKWLAVVR